VLVPFDGLREMDAHAIGLVIDRWKYRFDGQLDLASEPEEEGSHDNP
jgi:hypothetical protein